MKKKLNSIVFATVFFCSLFAANAQQVNNMYFIENSPVRHYLNPALQPLSGFYLALPVIGYSQFGFGNNSFTASSFDGSIGLNTRLDAIKTNTLINYDTQINLFGFGFRAKSSYFTFGVTTKAQAYIGLPKEIFNVANNGVIDSNNKLKTQSYDFKSLSMGANAYTEFAFGYAKKINEKWAYGLKLKYLHGMAAAKVGFTDFSIATSPNASGTLKYNFDGTTNYTYPDVEADVATLIKPLGRGAAVDLGLTYKPLEFLTFAAGVTDLGRIVWSSSNAKNTHFDGNYTFTDIDSRGKFETVKGIDDNAIGNNAEDNVGKLINVDPETANSFSTNTNAKLNISAEAGVLKNAISLGVLSTTLFHDNKTVYQDITTSLNLRPINWFNVALSYSLLNGRGSNIGAGLGFRLGFINAFVSADYIPVNWKTYTPALSVDLTELSSQLGVREFSRLPYKTDRLNLAVGVNIVFGNKQDKDKDGVSNRRDKCPDTPRKVIVDKKGCPVDTDGDGVADYLDKCPATPKEAYSSIDADGCPIDTDGDGVYDYLDKCPGTIAAAYGKVDENGCPNDTDKDGVADYIDKCDGTPEGVIVDSIGCPLDTDGDSVADYLDKCPATPVAARGMVDQTGCPIDTDLDGVFDYLDKCPNTPEVARALVDITGCPKDSDNDGVADYADKCPNTPIAAKGTVDENGCPKDTDGDGVLDYLDNCPRLAGVVSNKGCPEIKKEVRQLFQKALQGIQFETGKSTIKPISFKILDDVAKVLAENTTYMIEIQGHTDNVGKKDANQKLSESRAKAVRDYLVNKGIAEKRITSNGYGDTKPVLPNTSAKNKAKNRRVEFVVSFEEVKIVEEKL